MNKYSDTEREALFIYRVLAGNVALFKALVKCAKQDVLIFLEALLRVPEPIGATDSHVALNKIGLEIVVPLIENHTQDTRDIKCFN